MPEERSVPARRASDSRSNLTSRTISEKDEKDKRYQSSARKTKDIREPPMLKDLAREVEAHPVGNSWYWKIGEGVYQDKLK